jgi:hypothetical protein
MRLPATLACLSLTLASPAWAITPMDVGAPSYRGAAREVHGGWEVTAGGSDIWGTSDQFTYVCEQKLGDFDVVVQLQELNPAQLYSRMGLMARASLESNSQHVFFAAFADNRPRHNNNGGVELQYRQSDGGPSAAMYPPSGPMSASCLVYYPHTWLRLKRVGNVFTAYTSQDASLWNVYNTVTMVQPVMLYVGVAVTAHDATKPAVARFSDFHYLAP